MIVVTLTYTAPLEALDAQLDAHRDWLKTSIDVGILLAAGRQVPRVGGLFLATGDKAAVEAWAKTDPFAVHGLADYSFTEVAVTMAAEGLEALK